MSSSKLLVVLLSENLNNVIYGLPFYLHFPFAVLSKWNKYVHYVLFSISVSNVFAMHFAITTFLSCILVSIPRQKATQLSFLLLWEPLKIKGLTHKTILTKILGQFCFTLAQTQNEKRMPDLNPAILVPCIFPENK